MFFKVKPCYGIKLFGNGKKLAPRFIGPFEALKLAGDGEVSYRLALPPYLSSSIYDVFHISALKKNIAVVSHVLNWYNLSIQKHLLCDEKP